jgi:SAM-dependent methyltransferase
VKRLDVAEYLSATERVEGWFFPIDALLFALVDEVQKRAGVSGYLFEIGVHHGKTALFLTRMASAGELVGVCDVFDQQELNRDRSGEGNLARFTQYLRELDPRAAKTMRVFVMASERLTTSETTESCRFFHIDGGHRPENVLADLRTASRALLPDGVVALDDVFNPSWPGVSEGFYRFMQESPGELVPILIGGNKVLLTRPAAVKRYERHWEDPRVWDELIAPQPFVLGFKEWLGRDVLTAIRQTWVDLDPAGAARLHARR